MKIAIPKEIKKQEYRVGLLPSTVHQLVRQGHTVLVERGAGAGTGYPDADYEQAGAKLMDEHAALFAEGDLVVKVKEPLPEEYGLMRPGQVLFTYFHLAA
ncbi:MAG: alanine dehydrogenase, partial [Verrucomicrobiota bacterium]|nr:alanine dehydrogenase [Verrucomicrobiota bacterium]